MIELDPVILNRILRIPWLSRCGDQLPREPGLSAIPVADRQVALQGMFSTQWSDVSTLAQADLTGQLARSDYALYGTTWNPIYAQAHRFVQDEAVPSLRDALRQGRWPESLAVATLPELSAATRASIGQRMAILREAGAWEDCLVEKITVSVERAILERTYRCRFRNLPRFFERLFLALELGHLPCGWSADPEDWPAGSLLVH